MKANFMVRTTLVIMVLLLSANATPYVKAAITSSELHTLTTSGNLTIGSRGYHVVVLQRLLVDETNRDPSIYPVRIISGYFGELTRAGLARLQAKHGISPAAGYFGPVTRATIGNLFRNNAIHTINTTTPNPIQTATPQPASADALPDIPNTDIKTSSAAKGYEEQLSRTIHEISFSEEQLDTLLEDGAVFPVPAILERLQEKIEAGDTAGIKSNMEKLEAWQDYFKKAYPVISETLVSEQDVVRQKAMLGWIKYSEQVISELGSDLTASKTTAIYERYKETYKANKNNIVKSLGFAKADNAPRRNFPLGLLYDWAMPRKALALIATGGTITIPDICLNGELLVIGPPAGGAYFLYWTVYAVNPFPFQAVTTGNWILGGTLPGPGICIKPGIPPIAYPSGSGTMTHYGTSLL